MGGDGTGTELEGDDKGTGWDEDVNSIGSGKETKQEEARTGEGTARTEREDVREAVSGPGPGRNTDGRR